MHTTEIVRYAQAFTINYPHFLICQVFNIFFIHFIIEKLAIWLTFSSYWTQVHMREFVSFCRIDRQIWNEGQVKGQTSWWVTQCTSIYLIDTNRKQKRESDVFFSLLLNALAQWKTLLLFKRLIIQNKRYYLATDKYRQILIVLPLPKIFYLL